MDDAGRPAFEEVVEEFSNSAAADEIPVAGEVDYEIVDYETADVETADVETVDYESAETDDFSLFLVESL